MTLRPKSPIDLMLAPVAAEIDANLRSLRDHSPSEIDAFVQLELNEPLPPTTPAERADRILRVACWNVDLYGWNVSITDDGCRLRLEGGSVSLDLGLGRAVMSFIEGGVAV